MHFLSDDDNHGVDQKFISDGDDCVTEEQFLSDEDDYDYVEIMQKYEEKDKNCKKTKEKKDIVNITAKIVDENTIQFSNSCKTESILKANGGVQIYENQNTFWNVPLKKYRIIINALNNKENDFEPKFELPPDSIFNAIATYRPIKTNPEMLNKLPKKILSKIMNHQRETILYAISRKFRILIADDMGLGKTIEAISCACAAGFPNNFKVIVFAPNEMLSSWFDNFLKYTDICTTDINMVKKPQKIAQAPLTIVSYSAALRSLEYFKEIHFDMAIVDESHNLRNPKTQTYKAVYPILSKVKYLLLLSGTPSLSHPSDLFTQLHLLQPKIFFSFINYGKRYCDGKFNAQGLFEANGCTNSEELKFVLQYLLMIRRQKDEVLDLPPKKRFHVLLDYFPSNAMKERMSQIRVFQLAIGIGMQTIKFEHSKVLMSLYSETANDKLESILNWLCSAEFRRPFFIENRKCLIFAHHISIISGIENWMNKQNIRCISITGKQTRIQRDSAFNQFRTDNNCRVAILSIDIASTGITLIEASLVVFAEFTWTPSDHLQAEDRVHRIGQKRDVEIFYLHAPGSLDDRIWEILEKKLTVVGSVIPSNVKTFDTSISC